MRGFVDRSSSRDLAAPGSRWSAEVGGARDGGSEKAESIAGLVASHAGVDAGEQCLLVAACLHTQTEQH